MIEILSNIRAYFLMWFNQKKFNELADDFIEEEKSKTRSTSTVSSVTKEYRELHLRSLLTVIISVVIGALAGISIEGLYQPSLVLVKIIRVNALLMAGFTVMGVFRATYWTEPYQEKISRNVMKYLYVVSLFLISMSLFMI